MSSKTHVATLDEINKSHKFHLVDAEGVILGRLATKIATVLQGKHKAIYTPFLDTGDHVVVINAEKIVLTGRKLEQKKAYRHTGYTGGLKEITYGRLMETHPERIISEAVRRMLPKSRLGRRMLKKLRVYRGAEHPHQAQNPIALTLDR